MAAFPNGKSGKARFRFSRKQMEEPFLDFLSKENPVLGGFAQDELLQV